MGNALYHWTAVLIFGTIISKTTLTKMMKKVFLLVLGTFLFSISLSAQRGIRIGYIDMDYILENVPEYQEASKQLDDKVNRWKGEIESKLGEVDAMKKQLDNERPLLTKELIEERYEEIQFEEDQILDYQQKRFGPGGDLAIQRRQLVEPVQDQVFNAVQEISTARKYDFVFDKSADVVMLYSADRHDISDQVLRSITRSARRKQINNRKEEDAFERDESKTVEQDNATLARQKEIEDKKAAREAALEERAQEREAQKAERQKAFEERRQRLLEERQRKKDSIAAARAEKTGRKNAEESSNEDDKIDPADARKAALEARQRRKDSILAARKKRRDSILNARKNRRPPSPENGEGEGGN